MFAVMTSSASLWCSCRNRRCLNFPISSENNHFLLVHSTEKQDFDDSSFHGLVPQNFRFYPAMVFTGHLLALVCLAKCRAHVFADNPIVSIVFGAKTTQKSGSPAAKGSRSMVVHINSNQGSFNVLILKRKYESESIKFEMKKKNEQKLVSHSVNDLDYTFQANTETEFLYMHS
jgi:hypothetical protein